MAIESLPTTDLDDELTYHPPATPPGQRNIYTLLRLAEEDPGSDDEGDDTDLGGDKKHVCHSERSGGDDADNAEALICCTGDDAQDDAQDQDEELEEGAPLTLPEEDYFKLLRAFGTWKAIEETPEKYSNFSFFRMRVSYALSRWELLAEAIEWERKTREFKYEVRRIIRAAIAKKEREDALKAASSLEIQDLVVPANSQTRRVC